MISGRTKGYAGAVSDHMAGVGVFNSGAVLATLNQVPGGLNAQTNLNRITYPQASYGNREQGRVEYSQNGQEGEHKEVRSKSNFS